MNDDIVPGFDDEKHDSIKLRLQKLPDIKGGLVVYASGYIDTYNSNCFKNAIMKAIEAGFVRLIFQVSAVNYMSSAAIGSFTSFLKTLKSRTGDMVLNQMQPKVYEVFQLLGFSQFFTVTDSLDEAYAYLSKEQTPAFPTTFRCPVCSKRLKASRSGRFRCGECKTILVIDEGTSVSLG